jgi:hypothetical protein
MVTVYLVRNRLNWLLHPPHVFGLQAGILMAAGFFGSRMCRCIHNVKVVALPVVTSVPL